MSGSGLAPRDAMTTRGEHLKSLFETKLLDAVNVKEAQRVLDWISKAPCPQERYVITEKQAATLQSYLPEAEKCAVEGWTGGTWQLNVSKLSRDYSGKFLGLMYDARSEYIARNIDVPMICLELEALIMTRDYKKGDIVQICKKSLGHSINTDLVIRLLREEGLSVTENDSEMHGTSYTIVVPYR